MNCPKCNSKLKCIETEQLDHETRYREYMCFKCELMYVSDEKLDLKGVKRSVPKRFKKTIRDSLKGLIPGVRHYYESHYKKES